MSAFVKRHVVLAYYMLVFAISWGAILVVVGPSGFLSVTGTSENFALVGLAALLGPSMAGVIMTGIVEGRRGFRELLSRLRRWRVGVRWYAVALLTDPLLMITTIFALSFIWPAFIPGILTADDKTSLLIAGITTGLMVPVFEELGWTGFVTPHLRCRYGVLATGIIMGLLWGAWHLPLFAGSTASAGEIPPALYLAVMLFSWLVPYRVLMVQVYDRTGSLLVAMLMHMPIVVSQYLLRPEWISGEATFTSLLVYGAMLWVAVAVLALATDGGGGGGLRRMRA